MIKNSRNGNDTSFSTNITGNMIDNKCLKSNKQKMDNRSSQQKTKKDYNWMIKYYKREDCPYG